MNTLSELQDEMQIYIHKNDVQSGPYDLPQVLNFLQSGEISRKDLVFYEGLGEWRPIEDLFEIEERLLHYMDEGQDADVVADIFQHVTHLTGSHEEIYYIAHQKKKLMKSRPDAVVVTNERLIIIHQGLGGSRTEDHLWKNVIRVEMKDGLIGTSFTVLDSNDHLIQVDDIPKPQLEKLCQIAHEMRVA